MSYRLLSSNTLSLTIIEHLCKTEIKLPYCHDPSALLSRPRVSSWRPSPPIMRLSSSRAYSHHWKPHSETCQGRLKDSFSSVPLPWVLFSYISWTSDTKYIITFYPDSDSDSATFCYRSLLSATSLRSRSHLCVALPFVLCAAPSSAQLTSLFWLRPQDPSLSELGRGSLTE